LLRCPDQPHWSPKHRKDNGMSPLLFCPQVFLRESTAGLSSGPPQGPAFQ
jgi:hypothetical protein